MSVHSKSFKRMSFLGILLYVDLNGMLNYTLQGAARTRAAHANALASFRKNVHVNRSTALFPSAASSRLARKHASFMGMRTVRFHAILFNVRSAEPAAATTQQPVAYCWAVTLLPWQLPVNHRLASRATHAKDDWIEFSPNVSWFMWTIASVEVVLSCVRVFLAVTAQHVGLHCCK